MALAAGADKSCTGSVEAKSGHTRQNASWLWVELQPTPRQIEDHPKGVVNAQVPY